MAIVYADSTGDMDNGTITGEISNTGLDVGDDFNTLPMAVSLTDSLDTGAARFSQNS